MQCGKRSSVQATTRAIVNLSVLRATSLHLHEAVSTSGEFAYGASKREVTFKETGTMTDAKLDDALRRITRLERGVRSWRWVSLTGTVATLGLAAALLLLLPYRVPNEVKARQFILIGDDGRERARLFSSQGTTALTLGDSGGSDRVTLSVSANDAMLALSGQSNRVGAFMRVGDGDLPSLGLADSSGTPRATLWIKGSDRSVQLLLAGEDGAGRADVTAPRSGRGILRLLEEKRKVKWEAK